MKMNLAQMNLKILPDFNESQIKGMKDLNLFDNDLREIPTEIFQMTSIEILNISVN
ncbi:hypothetical protein [Lysinibacillus fusiformis]|uniref:hypothetical protein n=1 Tax=Lysinibacillus fusiformis TaxID=28031 RepID=UPI00301810FB